ncbi:MAG: FtsQ-type POTRA domain-containing protein [Microlunatus sp.]|nr:FtsQ-type POTRA domain-containing protein [Microlunatus sp.]MDN5770173.1 FtsQ-type POTRA domain-containing protein [Microlunatus sp.]MDN5803606.1 FtsQ-type POTRA domain-containing protein [Microlunatus sp.]
MATTTRTRSGTESTRSTPSVARGRRRPRRRIWPLVLVGVLVVALLAGAGWLVGFSNVLAAHRVDVTGTRTLTDDQVRQAAAVPLGVPLARQDLGGIADRIAALPQVENVRVDRRWPETIEIVLTERSPVLVAQNGNALMLVDRHGVAYLGVRTRPKNLPLTTVGPGNTPLLAEVGSVAGAMPKKLRGQVATIRAESPYALVVGLESGVEVIWGAAEESELKGEIVLALLKQKPKTIDVSAPHNSTIR